MKKPTLADIRAAKPLTKYWDRLHEDRLLFCRLCGTECDPIQLWRECDEHDRPIPGPEAIISVCGERECQLVINRHPRLYVREETGAPGHFPTLCGDCRHRAGLKCTHPDLRENGGAGLLVKLSTGMPPGVIICRRGPGGCSRPPQRAYDCAGREVRSSPCDP